ncbi:asparaginase [Lentibacillus halophilus]|uniref:Asparaginase n=2 Tax=Lentibacillus halophilus TaxID=295065 RepID=A0ABN0ZDD6_9BACI
MRTDKASGDVTTANKHPMTDLTYYFQSIANVVEYIPFSLPSPQITPAHMLQLAQKIHELSDTYDGFVITHGTDTLEETAYFLDLSTSVQQPIIITGAMRSANEIGSDALYNLISSIRTAAHPQAWDQGVLVVMNDEIHTARHVSKTSTSNVATFQSPQSGPIGMITKQSILFYHAILKRHTYRINHLTKKVFLCKGYAGMDEELLETVKQAKPDGIVIEGLGEGNLPNNTVASLTSFVNDNIPVLMVSRCHTGMVQPTYGYEGGGKQLKEMGIIFAGGLTGPKARIELLMALEETGNPKKLKQIFEQAH